MTWRLIKARKSLRQGQMPEHLPRHLQGERSYTKGRQRLFAGVLAVAIAGGITSAAFAYFTGHGSGSASASIGSLTAATISAPANSGSTVTITWTAQAKISSAESGISYVVMRKPTSGSYAQVTSGTCSVTLTDPTVSCTDTSVPSDGTYSYKIVADYGSGPSWTATSNTVPVSVYVTAPVDSVALVSPSGAYLNTSTHTIYVNTNTGGSFKLSDAVTDTGSGPASATFAGVSATGWSGHTSSDTVTSGSGTAPIITYTSSTAYSFTTGAVSTAGTVTSKDVAGNTSSGVVLTLTPDSTGPTGGALSVNGHVASGAGTSSLTNATSYSVSRTDYSADAGSGFASSVLTVKYASWSANACGTYGAPSTITGSSTQTEPSGDGCYQYTLSGTDNVGNTSTLTTTVQVDTTAPSGGAISVPAYAKTHSVTITVTDFGDSGSGIASNVITRSNGQAPVNGVCPTSGYTGTNSVSNPDLSVTDNNCYVYTLTGTDLAGNSATASSSPVLVDAIAPIVPLPTVNGH